MTEKNSILNASGTRELNTPVPAFNVSAPELLNVIDEITDRAMQGAEKTMQAISEAPAEARPFLNELLALFKSVGYAGDSIVDDCNQSGLAEVWGIAASAQSESLGARYKPAYV